MIPENRLPPTFVISSEVVLAFRLGTPVVALESAVITHGLPRPQNLELARRLEENIRNEGAVPATICLMDGKVHIGLTDQELTRLANEDGARKISRRDFGIALARKENGGTTVAATLIAARQAGIRVFATGGIGGVHRNAPFDVSADLPELGRSPLIVVCAGAKSILDLPATMEVLETMGVAVIGYHTADFPAFYSRDSGLPVNVQIQSPKEAAKIALAHWSMGLESALLVVQPPPEEAALPAEEMNQAIQEALNEAERSQIHGSDVTPFLLDRVSRLSGGASLHANLALLENNARLAARISAELQPRQII
jgi:pseudouridine-5'-phosphate glycosidase